MTLEELNIVDGDFLLLEVQLQNKEWPMDSLDNREIAAKREVVELGDLYDVYDARAVGNLGNRIEEVEGSQGR